MTDFSKKSHDQSAWTIAKAGGVGAQILGEHGVQHPAGGIAFYRVEKLRTGELGVQTVDGGTDDGFLVEIEIAVELQLLQQDGTVSHGECLLCNMVSPSYHVC